MTKLTKILCAIVLVLVAVIVVQSVYLVQRQRDVAEYRARDRQRRDFCVGYRGMLAAVRRGMEAARKDGSYDQTHVHTFFWLTEPQFLNVCYVAEPTRTKVANRANWRCKQERTKEAAWSEWDFSCLEVLSKELEDAIPSTP